MINSLFIHFEAWGSTFKIVGNILVNEQVLIQQTISQIISKNVNKQ